MELIEINPQTTKYKNYFPDVLCLEIECGEGICKPAEKIMFTKELITNEREINLNIENLLNSMYIGIYTENQMINFPEYTQLKFTGIGLMKTPECIKIKCFEDSSANNNIHTMSLNKNFIKDNFTTKIYFTNKALSIIIANTTFGFDIINENFRLAFIMDSNTIVKTILTI